ncbi:hypothetical protein Peur_035610 [Populus x canadensis]
MAALALTHNLHFTPTLPLKTIKQHQQPKPKTLTITATSSSPLSGRKLRAAVIGGGPAGSSAAEALAAGGVETFLFERSPSTAKPCGGAIPLCMIDEFSIPLHLIDRHVTRMKIISPSNLTVDFGSKTLKSHEFIPMLRREVLDSFLRSRAQSNGAQFITGLVTDIEKCMLGMTCVFPKCDHVAVGTGTACARRDIKVYQRGIRERVKGGRVIKVEAHPIPEQPRPRRVRGRVALVGDAAGYVTKCSGEGIYFAAKSGRMCGEAIVKASEEGERMVSEEDLKREYLREWDNKYVNTFRFLDLLQRVFYGSNVGREALVELCGDEYVQRMTFDSYLYKKMASGDRWDDVKLVLNTFGSFMRCKVVGREMEALKL